MSENKNEKEFLVTVQIPAQKVVVKGFSDSTDSEILALAKKQISKNFLDFVPVKSYIHCENNGDLPLDFQNVFVGSTVKVIDDGRVGVVTKINRKTISVGLRDIDGRVTNVNGHPALFKTNPVEADDIESNTARNFRKLLWTEGECGYIYDVEQERIVDVVVSKITSSLNYQLVEIGVNSNKFWKVKQDAIVSP